MTSRPARKGFRAPPAGHLVALNRGPDPAQGLARVGDRLILSSVEILEAPVRYPEPVGGYDRTPGKGRGHVFVLDLNGNLQHDIVLGEGDMYHPGGIDVDGRSLLVPVAERRMMACTGITEYANAAGDKFELGGIAPIDLRSLQVRHEAPFQQYSSAGHVATRNPVHLENEGRTLRVWAAPDDGEKTAGTEILVYETRVPA
ncbi:DUF6454 family protein [Actinoplanes sp. NPDC048791]|uniref:DUF6454 family protein n=1 Tax=Actinoplanes sp. NPDC048791 TaxID=3154623 RepID=UPI0033C82B5B